MPEAHLGSMTWPEAEACAGRSLLVVPLGAVEQHGPHLPLDTDVRIATALAETWAARRADLVVAPPVAYGSSGEHQDFTGTLSIGQDATERVVVELVRSATAWRGVVLVCWHGGNAEPLARALDQVADRPVRAWEPAVPDGDAHAGRTETSLLLALAPDVVRLEAAAPGNLRPLDSLMPALRAGGVRSVAPNGVLGDPRRSSADEGRALLTQLVDDLEAAVPARWPG
jgi:creatinine amidohydrolase